MPQLLNAREVGRLLGINTESVKVMARRGELPGLKVRGKWRFTSEAVEQFIVDKIRASNDYSSVQCVVPRRKEKVCRSSNAVKCGGPISRSPVQDELASLLELGIERRRKSSTTERRRSSGASAS
jgi:excisionase family DNA binding protein